MPIEVYTGKPGNGKTTFMVDRLMSEAEKAERPLWAGGIAGLQPGLASVLKDPREWNAVKPGETCICDDTDRTDPCTAHVIPNGSLIFIDEAWKWFGHLHDASRQATPPHVLKLAEHRHRGIDFVWTTQGPNQLYPFVRPLCADHYHHVRRFGTQLVDVYHWQELQEDVKSTTKRESAQHTIKALPKRAFEGFKSAEVHTIKRKLPRKLLFVPVIIAGIALCAWGAALALAPPKPEPIGTPAPGQLGRTIGAAAAEPVELLTAEAWAARFVPRISGIPASAPAYDGREVVSYPQVWCGIGATMGCRCFTEQGTRYEMDQDQCATLVQTGGVYDPFKPARQDAYGATDATPAPLADDLPTASDVDALAATETP